HEEGEGEGRRRPLGRVVHHANEEVDREERAEEHDLRRDEEEHTERRRVDPRALVRDRRAVMGFGVGAQTAASSRTTCSTGSFESLCSRCTRFLLIQGERSGAKVETITSSVRSSWIACMAAV